jgi:hypothetical protein
MGIKTRGYTEDDRKKGRTAQAGARGAFPPEGEYVVLKIEDASYVDVSNGRKLQLVCALDVRGEAVERRWSGWTDNDAQMANAMEAIALPNDPDELEPDDMVGRGGFRAVVKHEPDKNGKVWANVAYLLPPSRAGGGGQRRDERQEPRREERRDDRRDDRREPARQEQRGGYQGRQGQGRTYGGNAPADDSDLPF